MIGLLLKSMEELTTLQGKVRPDSAAAGKTRECGPQLSTLRASGIRASDSSLESEGSEVVGAQRDGCGGGFDIEVLLGDAGGSSAGEGGGVPSLGHCYRVGHYKKLGF
ncbi:hypothetical protein PIB30_058333 [Stylosanthes scabra]|uniref:Uncharacterized protein n=1 Tax=Stylosanthes scabra TaxID=79078 RepID=A0ABU6XLG5_9FABA|nr:hypothetical protein [Stylosanthes scabra]